MTAPTARTPTVAFLLLSYRPDEPAGMERAVAGLTAGLRARGHRTVILTAAPQPDTHPDPGIIRLRTLPLHLPCDDDTLRNIIDVHRDALVREISDVLTRYQVDLVVYVDGLWGLGRLAAAIPTPGVLAVHVIGHPGDLQPALAAVQTVIAPSPALLRDAAAHGYAASDWRVVPNPLLVDPDEVAQPGPAGREHLRRSGPVRIAARLGREKGVTDLLEALPPGFRPVQLALGTASFEARPGSQAALLAEATALAARTGAALRPALRWREVPGWLAGAAVTVVPSHRETFGNLAAESLSAGTPVVGYTVGHLPELIGDAGVLVHPDAGPTALWATVQALLDSPVRYAATCGAAYYRARDYRPTTVADAFLKAVW